MRSCKKGQMRKELEAKVLRCLSSFCRRLHSVSQNGSKPFGDLGHMPQVHGNMLPFSTNKYIHGIYCGICCAGIHACQHDAMPFFVVAAPCVELIQKMISQPVAFSENLPGMKATILHPYQSGIWLIIRSYRCFACPGLRVPNPGRAE